MPARFRPGLYVPLSVWRWNVLRSQPYACDLPLELCDQLAQDSTLVPGSGRIDLHHAQVSAKLSELSGAQVHPPYRRRYECVEFFAAGRRWNSLFPPSKEVD